MFEPAVRSRPLFTAVVLTFLIGTAGSSFAQGLSARFGHLRAVEGERFVVRVELEDPSCALGGAAPCLLDTVKKVLVDVRQVGAAKWHTQSAQREPGGAWWLATFTSTVVPMRKAAEQPAKIEIRARVYGGRGGLLMELGDDEPLDVEVMSAPEARELDRALRTLPGGGREGDAAFTLVGYVGAEGRAGSSARARGLIGVGARASPRAEAVVYVAVGPAFSKPALLEGGGPLVLGFEGGVRLFAADPAFSLIAPFIEPYGGADLRFPGVDPALGLRAGVTWNVSADVAVEGSIGGAVVLFRAVDPEDRSSSAGASGGLRIVLRFGGRSEVPE